ncbi:cobalt transporter [Pasteurellaceae bacterium RH1A]|nr:cobalt transporter [Pasteurellaceae bacterium RH1A]
MQKIGKTLPLVLLLIGVALALYQLYPYLLFQVMDWQRSFNQSLASSLRLIGENSQQAGWILLGVSFLYGVFHAIGPGHGKFILTSYLALEETKLPQAMRLTLLSSLVQGLVAILLVSLIVVAFTLSRSYFNQTLQWVERGSFAIMILFGLYWLYQATKSLNKRVKKPKIQQIRPLSQASSALKPAHIHTENCGCGHQHLPSQGQLEEARGWKEQAMIILSIGARPCTGAILVLFLAYTLDLYPWGMAATLVMSIGTGLTLSLFAYLVLVARQKALSLSRWYFSHQTSQKLALGLKLGLGLVLIGLGILLIHGSFIEANTGSFFKR